MYLHNRNLIQSHFTLGFSAIRFWNPSRYQFSFSTPATHNKFSKTNLQILGAGMDIIDIVYLIRLP